MDGDPNSPGDQPGPEKKFGEAGGCHDKDRAGREGQDYGDPGVVESAERVGKGGRGLGDLNDS